MKLPLAYYGDSVLRKKTTPIQEIDDKIRQLVHDMEETMEANNGCGLAAPQIHQSISLFVTKIPRYIDEKTVLPGEFRVFINPKIVSYSPEVWCLDEACLSLPHLRGDVIRPVKVTFQATDLEGNTFVEEFVGFDARCMMHENDHLNGVLYIDRLSPKGKKEMEPLLREVKKKYSKH